MARIPQTAQQQTAYMQAQSSSNAGQVPAEYYQNLGNYSTNGEVQRQ